MVILGALQVTSNTERLCLSLASLLHDAEGENENQKWKVGSVGVSKTTMGSI